MSLHHYNLYKVKYQNEIVVAVEKDVEDVCESFSTAIRTHMRDILEWNPHKIVEYSVVENEENLPHAWRTYVSPYTEVEDCKLSDEMQEATIQDFFNSREKYEKELEAKKQENLSLSDRISKLEKQIQSILGSV
jgi:hypothetical protein